MQVPNKSYEFKGIKLLMRGLFLLVIWSLISSMWKGYTQTRRGFLRLGEIDKRTIEVVEENRQLKEKLEQVQSEEFKYKLIREKLRMQKGDEIVVVIPEGSFAIGQNNLEKKLKIWEKWMSLIAR